MAEQVKKSYSVDEALFEILAADLDSDAQAFLKLNNGQALQDYKQVASYNWLGSASLPIIVVPGAPKSLVRWTGGKLRRDEPGQYADENHVKLPMYPMEPIFRAVKIAMENNSTELKDVFKFQDHDIVTDRNNLRKLFAFVKGDESKRDTFFRIDVQVIGRLICLIRCQEQDVNERPGITFGIDFERRMTKPMNDICVGSFRQISSYQFGSLKILVRFEVDCADYEKSPPAKSLETPKICNKSKEVDANSADPLSDILGKLSLSENQQVGKEKKLQVQRCGAKRDYHLVELTTRRQGATFPSHVWPQMYFSGTESLVIGWQSYGNVKFVERFSINDVERKYGDSPPASTLAGMHCLLQKIVDFTRMHTKQEDQKDQCFSVVWQASFLRSIKFFENKNPERFVVSDDLKAYVAKN